MSRTRLRGVACVWPAGTAAYAAALLLSGQRMSCEAARGGERLRLGRVTETGFSSPQAAELQTRRLGVSWLQPKVPARLPVLLDCARMAPQDTYTLPTESCFAGFKVIPSLELKHE